MKDNFDVHAWNLKRYLNENENYLDQLASDLSLKYPNLDFYVRDEPYFDRIDVIGSEQDKFNFGDKFHGKKFGEYEVFAIDDDDRGEIVRIVKSDSILRENIEEGVVKDMHTFLNDLRDSGVTNMFGAAPYLQKEFGIDQKSARQVLANWMQSFSENLDYKDRKLSHEEEDRLDLIAHREFDNDFSKLSDEDKAKVFAKRDQVGVKESIKETIKFIMDDLEGYSNYFPGGKTKGLSSDEMSTILMQIVKDIEKEGEQLEEYIDNGPEEKAFDVEMEKAGNGIASAIEKELKNKKPQELNEALITSVIASILTGNSLIGFISKLSKLLFKKIGFKKGEDIAGKIQHWAHDNEIAFQRPIKRVLGFFIKDTKTLDIVTKAIYAIVVGSMAANYGAEAVSSLSKSDWFSSSLSALKTLAKSDETIVNAYPAIKALI